MMRARLSRTHRSNDDLLTVEKAARCCAERGVQLTTLRRLALEAMLAFKKPATAYDLKDALQERLAKHVAPTTAYRAIDFLMAQGFILRIEAIRAYVPASFVRPDMISVLCLCRQCGAIAQVVLPRLEAELSATTAGIGFHLVRPVVELHGSCADCTEVPRRS